MRTFADRLSSARIQAGFRSPQEAAERFGWNVNTYKSHDNGVRGGGRGPKEATIKKYARAFGVDWVWLATGEGSSGQSVKSASKNSLSRVSIASDRAATDFDMSGLEDNDRIQVSIGDLRTGLLRALRRGGSSEIEAKTMNDALLATLAELPGADIVRSLKVISRRQIELPTPKPGDQS